MDKPSINVTRWGHAGPAVIMVHGSAQGSRIGGDRHFSAQKRLAERGWRVVVPDRPGHGLSPDPRRPDDAEADGAWVADMLGDGAHLVGHSFGGCVVLAAAAQRPGVVRSLTLIEPGTLKLSTHNPQVRRFGLRLMATSLFSLTAANRAKNFARVLHIPAEIRGGADPAELKRMGQAVNRIRVPSKETLERQIVVIKDAGIPLLIVTGGWNPAFEVNSDEVALRGNGRRLVIASPHHFPQLVSDEFNLALGSFMDAATLHGNPNEPPRY